MTHTHILVDIRNILNILNVKYQIVAGNLRQYIIGGREYTEAYANIQYQECQHTHLYNR